MGRFFTKLENAILLPKTTKENSSPKSWVNFTTLLQTSCINFSWNLKNLIWAYFGPIQRRFVQKTPEQDIFPKKGFFVYITWSKYKYKNKTSLIFLFHTPRDRFSTRTTKKIASLLNHILLKSQFVIYKIT